MAAGESEERLGDGHWGGLWTGGGGGRGVFVQVRLGSSQVAGREGIWRHQPWSRGDAAFEYVW